MPESRPRRIVLGRRRSRMRSEPLVTLGGAALGALLGGGRGALLGGLGGWLASRRLERPSVRLRRARREQESLRWD